MEPEEASSRPRRGYHSTRRGHLPRKRVTGFPRRFRMQVRLSATQYLALQKAADYKRMTRSRIVEEALWAHLSRLTVDSNILERLRYAGGLIHQSLAEAYKQPLKEEKGPVANIHEAQARQERRNRLSQRMDAAFEAIYELSQSEQVAAQNQMRAAMYGLLTHMAATMEMILRGAAEEEILAEMSKLHEEQRAYEEATRQLEEQTKADSAKA
jgi:hypothetical protein